MNPLDRISTFFESRQHHNFLVLSGERDTAYLLMDVDEKSRPYVVVSGKGCAQHAYRDTAEKGFIREVQDRSPIETDECIEVLCIDRENSGKNFDFGVTYLAFLDEDTECLMVYDKFGDLCRCFRNRFQIPGGFLKFFEVVKGATCN